jgi:hypothetical protein
VNKIFVQRTWLCKSQRQSLFPRKMIKRIQTEVMPGSPRCRLGSIKLIDNSSDDSSRTALYHFQYVILHLGSVTSLWSFTLSLFDSTSWSDTLVHITEHSAIWHSEIRKSPQTFFNCCSCVTITKAIHDIMSAYSYLENVAIEHNRCFLAHSNKTTACNNRLANLTAYDANSRRKLSENVFGCI